MRLSITLQVQKLVLKSWFYTLCSLCKRVIALESMGNDFLWNYKLFLSVPVTVKSRKFKLVLFEILAKSRWVWSGYTIITNCRPTNSTVKKGHRTFTATRHLQDNKNKATSSLLLLRMIAKLKRTKVMHTEQRPPQNPHKQWAVHKAINQQQQNHRLRKVISLSYW